MIKVSNIINKTATKWEDEEFVKWANDEVKVGPNISERAVVKEAIARFGLEEGDMDSVKSQIRAEAVSDEETAEEEVLEEGPTVQTDAEGNSALVFTQDVFNLNKNAHTPTETKGAGITLNAGVTAQEVREAAKRAREGLSLKVLQDSIDTYVKKMSPGVPHVGDEGSKQQAALYRIIQNVFNLQGKDFIDGMNVILETVKEHRKAAFNERYVFRYMNEVKLTATERKNFERVVNLFLVTCDKTDRKQNLKQVDLSYTVEGYSDPSLIQKLTEFYSM